MKKVISKIGQVLQVILHAPVKLPGKALNIIRYIALVLGVVETVLDDKDKKGEEEASIKRQSIPDKEKERPNETE